MAKSDALERKQFLAGAIGSVLFLFFAGISFWMSVSSWDGMIYVSDLKLKGGTGRVPAAIPKNLDFSRLNGAELMTASRRRLFSAARIVTSEHRMGIEFGQFIIRSNDGLRQLSCDFYDQVKVRLQAEGIAVSGERPQVEIVAPCTTSTDLALTNPIWIPTQEILASRVKDGKALYSTAKNSTFLFSNMPRYWPTRWSVTEVVLFQENSPNTQVRVGQSEMHGLGKGPLLLDWSSGTDQ